MKRVIIVFIVLVAIIVPGNAQFFVEGSIGVNYDEAKTLNVDNTESTSALGVNISPKVGYWLNDRIAVGLNVSYSRSSFKKSEPDTDNPGQEKESEYRYPNRSAFVFGRYKLLEKGKLTLLLDGSFGIGKLSAKEKTGTNWKEIHYKSTIDIGVYPAVSYNLTDRWSLITTCDFLYFGFFSSTEKSRDSDTKYTHKHFGFDFKSTIFSSLNNIKIGFIYNF